MNTLPDSVKQAMLEHVIDVYDELREIDERANQVKIDASNVACDRDALVHRARTALKAIEEVPGLVDAVKVKYALQGLQWHIKEYDEGKDDPIEKLLDWSLDGSNGRSFIMDESYDILGKDAARSLRSLLRNVLVKYDPQRSNI